MANTPLENLPIELQFKIFSPFKDDKNALINFSTFNRFFKELIDFLFLTKIKTQEIIPFFYTVLKGNYENEPELIKILDEKLSTMDMTSFLNALLSFRTKTIGSAPKGLINLLGETDPLIQFLKRTNQQGDAQYWFEFTEKYLQIIQNKPFTLLHKDFMNFRSHVSVSLFKTILGLPLMLLLHSESRLENKRTLLKHIIHELKEREEIVRQKLLGVSSYSRIKNKLVDYHGGGKELYGTSRFTMAASVCALATLIMLITQGVYGAIYHEPLLIFPNITYIFLEGVLNQVNKIIPNSLVMGLIAEIAVGGVGPTTAFFGYLLLSFVNAFKTVRNQNTYSTQVLSSMRNIIDLFESCFDPEEVITLDTGIKEIKLTEAEKEKTQEIISDLKTDYQPEVQPSYRKYPGTLWKGIKANLEEEIKEKTSSNRCVFV